MWFVADVCDCSKLFWLTRGGIHSGTHYARLWLQQDNNGQCFTVGLCLPNGTTAHGVPHQVGCSLVQQVVPESAEPTFLLVSGCRSGFYPSYQGPAYSPSQPTQLDAKRQLKLLLAQQPDEHKAAAALAPTCFLDTMD